MSYPVTMLYASLLGILLILLSWGVSKVRLREHISLGAGEVSGLESAIRAHGNFIEYVPLALILMMLAESTAAASWLLHMLGEIKRRTRVATLFPNEASCLRLVTAVVMETSDEWETGRIYLTMDEK